MASINKDITMSSDNESPGSFPPPRIAARFSKTTTSAARRKSSAASSRRNSMSSHHSSKSALSAHGGPQSTHIAQHLRRASLLESRKARLAEKAAHAEKVRLRAAVAKAAPRVNANSEERALAAKVAREKYLAQVAANCHEEVKRAKKIAEDAREKKAAEHLRMKSEMEERLAEAEKRRVLLQHKKNTTLAPVEERITSISAWRMRNEAEATLFLQRAWRNRQRRRLVSELAILGLTREAVRAASFDDVGALLNQERILTCISSLLKLYRIQKNGPIAEPEKAAVRMFLSAFLITSHPQQVLSQDGVREQELLSKATILLELFEHLTSQPFSYPAFSSLSPQLTSFVEAYSSYQVSFSAWKDQDSSILVNTMIAQFVELDAIWQSVKDDTAGGVADDYRESIQQNQTLILVRLKKLVGSEEGMKMIRKAVKEARAAKAQGRKTQTTKHSRPRAASIAADPTATISAGLSGSTFSKPKQSPVSQEAALNKALGTLPSNRNIIHELAINHEYRIDLEPRMEMKDEIIRTVSENMRRLLENDIGGKWVGSLVETMRKKLLGLVVPGKSMHNMISEALDPGLVAQQVDIGAFSYQQFLSFINSLLPQLCAPVRDAEVMALKDHVAEDPFEQLARINYVIDLLSIDHANFTLQMNSRMLLEQAATYEQMRFSESYNGHRLIKTRQWWRQACLKTRDEFRRRTGETSTTQPTRERIYIQGLIDTAVSAESLNGDSLPETLELDEERLIRIRSDIQRIITIEAVILTAKKLLKRDVRSQWKSEAQRMWDISYDDPQAFLSAIPHTLPPATKAMLTGTTKRILEEARNNQAAHPVKKVLLQKLKSHILTRLSATSTEERLKATTTANDVLASIGLSEFITQIGTMIDELKRVAYVDREAHGKWYDEIADTTNA